MPDHFEFRTSFQKCYNPVPNLPHMVMLCTGIPARKQLPSVDTAGLYNNSVPVAYLVAMFCADKI